jgi:phosphoribosyl 1,2-cyclic phosphodiesterase
MTTIIFHGTRGSFPTSAPTHAKYGGHTSCVSVLFNNQWFIFDGGSGLIDAHKLAHDHDLHECHVFLSHFHLDHICGLPAFPLSWDPAFTMNFYCGMSLDYNGTEEALSQLFKPPYFPVSWQDFKAKRTYTDFRAGQTLTLQDGVSLKTTPLDHPNGGCGYRLNLGDQSLVYLTDTTHQQGSFNRFVSFAYKCDLLIYDSTYCESEFEPVASFGHSTWQAACDLANQASVGQLALFHHDPSHTDAMIDAIEAQAPLKFPRTFAAACGMSIEL